MKVVLQHGTNSWRTFDPKGKDEFEFKDIEPGRHKIVLFSDEDIIAVGDWFETGPGEDKHLGTIVTEPAGSVLLHISYPDGTEGEPVRVHLSPDGTIQSRKLEIRGDAEKLVENLTPGRLRVSVYSSGFATEREFVEVEAGTVKDLKLTLRPAVRRDYEVVYPQNHALGGLRVYLDDAQGKRLWDFKHRNSGALSNPYQHYTRLPIGKYTMRAESGSGLKAEVTFEVTTMAEEQQLVRLELK